MILTVKFFLVFLDPNFKEPIANVTAPVGREAILSCVVQDLAEYKVSFLLYLYCYSIGTNIDNDEIIRKRREDSLS